MSVVDTLAPSPQPNPPLRLLAVSHLGYVVHGHISLEVSGRVDPSLTSAAPDTLWLVSFPRYHPVGDDGRPGSETWYPIGVLRPDADGCFETTPLQLSSYDGAHGIVFHMALARLSVDRSHEAAAWLAENSAEGWKDVPADVELLDTFDVDSGQFEVL